MKVNNLIKNSLVSFSLAAFCVGKTNAQLNVKKIDSATNNKAAVYSSNVISQLVNGINTNAFSNSFLKGKNSFLINTGKITAAETMAKEVAVLARSIKTNKFKSGITAETIVKNSNTITSMSEVAAMLKNLQAGLKPGSFSPLWKLQKQQWIVEVDKLN